MKLNFDLVIVIFFIHMKLLDTKFSEAGVRFGVGEIVEAEFETNVVSMEFLIDTTVLF